MSAVFWTSRPSILLQKDKLGNLWPLPTMTPAEKQNAMSRLVILLTLVGYAVSRSINVVITGVVALGIIVFLNYTHKFQGGDRKEAAPKKAVAKEGFDNQGLASTHASNPYKMGAEGAHVEFTKPTPSNPMMNVMLTEITDNPYRNAGGPSFDPLVEDTINKTVQANTVKRLTVDTPERANEIDERLFRDLGDAYQFDQSMQRFYTCPNTQIPNDQTAFAQYLYGDMPSCKAGDSTQCIKNNARHVPY
jgi:hypothetical protein